MGESFIRHTSFYWDFYQMNYFCDKTDNKWNITGSLYKYIRSRSIDLSHPRVSWLLGEKEKEQRGYESATNTEAKERRWMKKVAVVRIEASSVMSNMIYEDWSNEVDLFLNWKCLKERITELRFVKLIAAISACRVFHVWSPRLQNLLVKVRLLLLTLYIFDQDDNISRTVTKYFEV